MAIEIEEQAYLYKYAAIPKIIHNRMISMQKLRLDLSWNITMQKLKAIWNQVYASKC